MRKIIFVLILFSYKMVFAQTGWYWQNPKPQGMRLAAVEFVNSNTGFAAGNDGVFVKTTNSGISWSSKSILPFYGVRNHYCYGLTSTDANTLFALYTSGTSYFIMKSTNAGDTWDSTAFGTGFTIHPTKIFFVSQNTGYCYGTNSQLGVYKTTNAGANWYRYSISSLDSLRDVFFLNENTGWIGKTGNNFFKTTNGGSNWSTYTFPENFTAPFFINENTGWAISINHLCYKSTNGGINYSLISGTPGDLQDYRFLNAETGWAIFNNDLYITTNSGSYWAQTYHCTFPESYWSVKFTNQNTGFAVGEFGSILNTGDAGQTWKLYSNSGLSFSNVTDIFMSDENTGWALNGGKIVRTTNGGAAWRKVDSLTTYNSINFINAQTGIAAGNNFFSSTTNAGANWTVNQYTGFSFNLISVPSASVWFVGGRNSNVNQNLVLKSTNFGLNWSNVPFVLTAANQLLFLNENTGYCASSTSFAKTTNGGSNWQFISSQILEKIFFINETTGWGLMQETIFKTTNAGINWQQQFSITGVNWKNLNFINQNTGWVVWGTGYKGDIYKTTNGGSEWLRNSNIPGYEYYSIKFINDNTGWIGSQGGTIIKTTTGGTIGVQQISTSLPDKFYLEQNYPNPFNPNTVIRYQLTVTGFTTLKVFDLLGKEVATLVNERQPAGSYAVDFNSAEYNLPSGIYFYTLTAGEFKETRKMVLIK